jgi:hypothetical protein
MIEKATEKYKYLELGEMATPDRRRRENTQYVDGYYNKPEHLSKLYTSKYKGIPNADINSSCIKRPIWRYNCLA